MQSRSTRSDRPQAPSGRRLAPLRRLQFRPPRTATWHESSSWRCLELGPCGRRHVVKRCAAAALQGSNISHDSPAIPWFDARGIGVHRAVSGGDDVEEMLVVCGQQTRVEITRRMRHSALHHHAVAIAGLSVAGRAINLESVLAAREQFARHGRLGPDVPFPLGVTSGDRAGGWRAQAAASKLRRVGLAVVFRLRVLVLVAAGVHQRYRGNGRCPVHEGTSSTVTAPAFFRNAAVWLEWNFLSSALMERKNRSLLARRKRLALKTG